MIIDQFQLRTYEQQFKTIRNRYEMEQKREKESIDKGDYTKEEKKALYGTLGRFKKMAKNEMIVVFIEEHIDDLKSWDLSQNMVLDIFKDTIGRQPNQNERVFEEFNGEGISRKEYGSRKKQAVEKLEALPKFPVLKRAVDY